MKLKSKWNSKQAPPPKSNHIAELAENLACPPSLALEFYYIFGPEVYNVQARAHKHCAKIVAEWFLLWNYFSEQYGNLNPTQARALLSAACHALTASERVEVSAYATSLMALRFLRRDDDLHEQMKLLRLTAVPQPAIIGKL